MITINGKEFRNLEEQVQKNKEDIAAHYNIDRVLADFGIKIIGQISDAAQLPDPETFTGDYGDAYAVGASDPYSFYIWTRADVNAGHPNDYWFNIGPLAIVGPQGPRGAKGDKGDKGESSTWYYGSIPGSARVGDMLLNQIGNIYRYDGAQWPLLMNIRGSQGPQGPVGPQGETGPQGPQGIQGPQGDVGGFINIYGILSSEDQLPTPQSLNNLSVAYLIGSSSPYDLYIQIGATPEEATWNNAGPFNTSTLVSVEGQYQNTWNADTKLDKVTTADPYNRMRAYVIDRNLNQTTIPVGGAGGIALMNSSSMFDVPSLVTFENYSTNLTTTPKGYVINNFSPKLYRHNISMMNGDYSVMIEAQIISSRSTAYTNETLTGDMLNELVIAVRDTTLPVSTFQPFIPYANSGSLLYGYLMMTQDSKSYMITDFSISDNVYPL